MTGTRNQEIHFGRVSCALCTRNWAHARSHRTIATSSTKRLRYNRQLQLFKGEKWNNMDAYPCDRLADTSEDASVDVEEVVTGHSGLAGHSSWDNYKVAACESLVDSFSVLAAAGSESGHFSGRVCVGEVDPDTCSKRPSSASTSNRLLRAEIRL